MILIRLLFICIILFTTYPSISIHVLFVMDTISDTKTVILNQAIGLIERGFSVSILAKTMITPLDKETQLLLAHNIYIGNLTQFNLDSIDIIICQYGTLGKEYAHFLHDKRNIKLVTFLRGSDITAHHEICNQKYTELFSTCDLFLPVCSYYAYLLEILGCDPQKILVQPSGINCTTFPLRTYIPPFDLFIQNNTQQNSIQFISVNRLIKKKGIKEAMEAVAHLIHAGYNIEYTIVGDGKHKDKLMMFAQQLNIQNRVHFIGHKPNKEIAQLLEKSHLFIATSITCSNGSQEGIPNAIKEAMAVGVPVVSTYHAGIRELVHHNESGFLVPERDVRALIKTIKYIITHPKKWSDVIINARAIIEKKYDMNYLNDLLASRITALIKTNHTSRIKQCVKHIFKINDTCIKIK